MHSDIIFYFVIMYTIHIIKALHIVHIFEFCFELTITSIFGTATKTQFIQIIQLFQIFLNINFLIFLWFTFCSIICIFILL